MESSEELPLARASGLLSRVGARLYAWQWQRQGHLYLAQAERRRRRRPPRLCGLRTRPHGEGGGTYHVVDALLSAASVVYSFGVGCDTSFEASLIERHALTVFAFDPTEESRRYLEVHPPPKGFVFEQCGVAAADGSMALRTVKRASAWYRAGTLLEGVASTDEVIEVPVRSMRSLMQERHHAWIDLLKLDIEGGEYAVLDALLADGIPARQLVLEVHPHLLNLARSPFLCFGPGWKRTDALVRRIEEDGFSLAHVSQRGTELCFVR